MTSEHSVLEEAYSRRVKELASSIESGNEDEAARLLDELTSLREKALFQELGRLTRDFHEALQSFRLDARIVNIASKDFPDARERLNYVINMTAESADRTMTAIEQSMPVCDRLEERAQELKNHWERFTSRQMGADEFRDLSRRLGDFLGQVATDTPTLRNNLQEVLMAQDFQDLTGQIIQRVIRLVDEMESSLVDLIRISGQGLSQSRKEEEPAEEDKIKAVGPAVPGLDQGTVTGQDEVDDLLSSLGF